MGKRFTIDKLKLAELLKQAGAGDLQLPDFQRDWVWDDNHIKSLLASISLSYPIGAVMTLETGNPDVRFRFRPLERVKLSSTVEPELMLLDGQQRLTSLFLALNSPDPVPTRDQRGKAVGRHYYADINACLDPVANREEQGIVSVPKDRVVRTDFGRTVQMDLRTCAKQIAAEMFPLDIVLDDGKTMRWQMAYLKSKPGDYENRLDKWEQFNQEIIQPFKEYQVPTIELDKSTPKNAVCQVFEKVNTSSVTLTVFDLLTATYAADDFNLRDDWERRKKKLKGHELIGEIEATAFLQIVTLLATYDQRRRYLSANPDREKAPAVLCNRRDILRLSSKDYKKWAKVADRGLKLTIPFLHEEHIFRYEDLPYAAQLIPLGAIFGLLDKKVESNRNRQRLRQWFWCGVFGEMYGGSVETRFANDLQDCVSWIANKAESPRTLRDAQFQAERLLTLRTRNSAAYKGLYALQMKRGSRDFKTGNPIDANTYFENTIDISHVFPKRWCSKNRISLNNANCIVNKIVVDKHTNRLIGGNAPSEYLQRIETSDKIRGQDFNAILVSHDIDPLALRQDDFKRFFNHRFERLLRQIEDAMGKPANRSAKRDESPFFDADRNPEMIKDLISRGEGQFVEFKSTGRKNLRTGEKDPAIEWAVVKTLCGFMNTHGGTLLIGVDDHGTTVGIEQDYSFVDHRNRDGWERWLTRAVSNAMETLAATELSVSFCSIDDKMIARIDVRPSTKPIFATEAFKGKKKRDVFFTRIGAATEELQGKALHDYQRKQWPDYKA